MSSHYCPHTPDEIREMLAVIGVQSVEDLFAPIPLYLRSKPSTCRPACRNLKAMPQCRRLLLIISGT